MSSLLDELKHRASRLPDTERAELAIFILDTLEPEEQGAADAWRSELDRRMAEIRSGAVVGIPMDDVLARLRERFP
jgi:putative addiction module component (TIGR02574 family)